MAFFQNPPKKNCATIGIPSTTYAGTGYSLLWIMTQEDLPRMRLSQAKISTITESTYLRCSLKQIPIPSLTETFNPTYYVGNDFSSTVTINKLLLQLWIPAQEVRLYAQEFWKRVSSALTLYDPQKLRPKIYHLEAYIQTRAFFLVSILTKATTFPGIRVIFLPLHRDSAGFSRIASW